MNRSAPCHTGASAPVFDLGDEESRRFRLSCRMLRLAGHFDKPLPGQRRGESPIDWLVRLTRIFHETAADGETGMRNG